MYLESFKIKNFRKFGTENNKILFANEKKEVLNTAYKFDVSTAATLVIGKNNTGKTTIVEALNKLAGKERFNAFDFNFTYLKELMIDYDNYFKNRKNENEEFKFPEMSFEMKVHVDNEEDIVSVIGHFLLLEDTEMATIKIGVHLKEERKFEDEIQKMVKGGGGNNFRRLLEIINEVGLDQTYKNADGVIIPDFNMRELIEIKSIEANTITQADCLTKAFNKIISYRYKNREKNKNKEGKNSNGNDGINNAINKINNDFTKMFDEDHTTPVNKSLAKIESSDKLEVSLRSDLTHQKLLDSNILIYEYMEKGMTIPETQYGLGYTNLVMIIAEIIEYIENSPGKSFTSMLNFISIEEPETYMHPQMQELFIKNINEALNELLDSQDKYIHSQLIITTHSSHVLNSKIHDGNTFNYINYCTNVGGNHVIVNLRDENIVNERAIKLKEGENLEYLSDGELEKLRKNELMFIKKHIKYKVSELFFSDAVIFVEGITEETLLNYWIDQDKNLQYYYISIFNINGAYGHIYDNLIKELKVPTLIITDLDIKKIKEKDNSTKKDKENQTVAEREEEDEKRKKEEKEKNERPIKCVKDLTTTNETLKFYINDSVKKITEQGEVKKGNLFVTFQNKVTETFPSSFEEALILSNTDNKILRAALSKTKPKIYQQYCDGDSKKLIANSRLFQNRLNDAKGEFTNNLLYELVNDENEGEDLNIPVYIKSGLSWIKEQLKAGEKSNAQEPK